MPDAEKLLLSAAAYVARNQAFYQADESIYGRFPDLYAELSGLSRPEVG
jgi:hypothetical protein